MFICKAAQSDRRFNETPHTADYEHEHASIWIDLQVKLSLLNHFVSLFVPFGEQMQFCANEWHFGRPKWLERSEITELIEKQCFFFQNMTSRRMCEHFEIYLKKYANRLCRQKVWRASKFCKINRVWSTRHDAWWWSTWQAHSDHTKGHLLQFSCHLPVSCIEIDLRNECWWS